MLDKLLELSTSQGIGDGWVSYQCPFCQGKSRPILNIRLNVGRLVANCFSTACEAHGHRIYDTNIKEEDLVYELQSTNGTGTGIIDGSTFSIPGCVGLPEIYRTYLSNYGVGIDLIKKYRIGYSEAERRMIIPCADGYLARSEVESPKWKNYTTLPFITGDNLHGRDMVDASNTVNCSSMVLDTLYVVEDPISAIRLGEYVDTMALLGTTMQDIHMDVAVQYNKVCIWLDPDSSGYRGILKIKSNLGMYVDTTIIHQSKEPKELTNYELKEVVNAFT